MVKQAAQVIGLLVTILLMVVWMVLNNHLPTAVGFGVNIIVLLASMLAGLFAYVAVVKG